MVVLFVGFAVLVNPDRFPCHIHGTVKPQWGCLRCNKGVGSVWVGTSCWRPRRVMLVSV